MQDIIQRKVNHQLFPFGVATSGRGVTNKLAIVAAGSFAIPSYWKGKFLRVYCTGNDCQVSVTVATQTLVYNQSSDPTGTPSLVAGWPIPNGSTCPDGIVPLEAGYFNYVGASATAFNLFFFVSEPDAV